MAEGPREEIDALAAEGAKITALLRSLDTDAWSAPTRCPPWTVRELVVHMLSMVEHMGDTAGRAPVADAPVKDRVTWWDYDIEEDQEATREWVEKASTDYPVGPLTDLWSVAVDECVAAVNAALADGNRVVRPGDYPILLADYVATRVLEITIHSMDVRDAFGLEPDPSPEGLEVTLGILASRLGADPLALGFDASDFILLSTGRRPITDQDRSQLGDHATKLPLLA